MALYRFEAQIIGRAAGKSAVASAAYRHTTRMVIEATGRVADYSRKRQAAHSEFALPENAPEWIRDLAEEASSPALFSQKLWNMVEAGERRSDAQFARELLLSLPTELTPEQNIEMVRDFVQQEITSRGFVADWAYHNVSGNPHVHLMMTLRPLAENGFGPKWTPVLDATGNQIVSPKGHKEFQLWNGRRELLYQWREQWANVHNAHMATHGFDITVDHRSYAARGIDLKPTLHRGPRGVGMEDRGQSVSRMEAADLVVEEQRLHIMDNPGIVLKLLSAQQSVFDERDIARIVNRYTNNYADFQSMFLRVGQLDDLVQIANPVIDPESGKVVDRAKYTTRETLNRENNMMLRTIILHEASGFAVKDNRREQAVASAEQRNGFAFDGEQRQVIERLTEDRAISVMVGFAGAGKSTVMGAVREIYEEEGHRVFGAALAGKAAVGLEESAGIQSRTIASWQASWKNDVRRLQKGDVFVLDEGGMVSSQQFAEILIEVVNAKAKLIVLGDPRQLQPIESGLAFRVIANEIGYVELSGVRRQSEAWMQSASMRFGAGKAQEALQAYWGHDRVVVRPERVDALNAMIDGWQADWAASSDVVMLAHRNADVFLLNAFARERIQESGGLEQEVPFLTARGKRQFAVGERVVFLEKSNELGVQNGTIGTIVEAAPGKITVDTVEGRQVSVNEATYNALDYGYATTIHKSQGATVDRAHVYASTTMDAALSYVALSRHREDVHLYASVEEFGSGKSGKLVDHGVAPFEHKQKNRDSYFVTLEDAKGKQHTTGESNELGL